MKSGSLSAFLILHLIIYNKALEICEDGWSRFSDTNGNWVCTLVVKDGVGWTEAMEICEEKLGNLLVLDNFGDLSYSMPNDERIISFGQELVTSYSVEEFWSGMYVDRGRLMWDDYGPKLVERSKFQGSQYWRWGEGHPDPEEGACGKATVSKRVTTQGTVYNYNRVTVNLTACETKLPFVCRKPPVDKVVKTAAFCPENWIGNQYVPHCYRIYKEPLPYEKARARCREEGADMAPSDTLFHLYFLEAVYNFYLQNDKYFEVTAITNIWVLDTNKTERCSALDTSPSQSNIPAVVDVDCFTPLLFFCGKGTKYAGSGYIETNSPYFDQEQLLDYKPFKQLPVYGVLDRHLRENEVIFVRTPSIILNSTNSYTQWSSTGLYWTVQESDRVSVPYYVNISLPRNNQSPARRRRDGVSKNSYIATSDSLIRQFDFKRERRGIFPSEGEDVFRDVDYNNVRQTTGYYTFGIYNINPPRYRERPPQLVRYSERSLYLYVAYCDLFETVIGPSSQEPSISREDVNSFNLLQDDSYIAILQEIGLSTVLYEYPAGSNSLIEYYRSQIEFFINNTVKFRIFVVPRSGRELTSSSEQTVLSVVYEHFDKNLPIDLFDKTTLQVRSTVTCPSLETVKDGKTLTFQPVRAGETGFSWERCYPDNKALATSTCGGGYDDGATWRQILLADECGSVPEYNQSDSTVNLKNLSETDITEDNFEKVLNETALLTTPDVHLTEGDIIYTAKILYNFLQLDLHNTPKVMDTVIKVVDNVLRSGQDVINSAQKITNAANRIILTVDELTNRLGLFGVNIQFVQDLVASEVWEQTGTNNLIIGISLNKTGTGIIEKKALSSVQQPGDVVVMETDTAIYLSQSSLKGGRSKLAFHIYGDPGLFTVISSRFKVNSKVVAARLTKDNVPVFDLEEEYVTAVFDLFENSKRLVCAYWNYSANEDAGGWGTDGCTLFTHNLGRVVCKCNHLTNFAVLIDLEAESISDTDKIVLGIITKVGLCISIAGLGFTIVTFLVFKHLRSGRGQQVLMNLSVAMLCSAILFLVGVDRTESYGGCIAVSVLLHYFILVTFMWMLVEGVLQYLRFVKVLGTYIPNFMIKSIIPAWGIPLIPVIIVLAIDYDMYYGGKGYCWLSLKPFLYAFLIPVAAIILANIIVFMLVMCNLCCRRKNKGMVSNQSEKKMAFLHFQAGVSILVILGVTWVFGFLTIDDTRIVFHYLFAIFNAFQGFFIFLLFTAREKQIRKAWRKLCCKKAPYKSNTSGADSYPRIHSADTTNSSGLLSHSGGVYSSNKTNFSNGDNQFGNPHYDNNI